MIIDSTIVIPELEYWFYNFLLTTYLNVHQISYPATFQNDIYLGQKNSFIRLLFDDNWPTDLSNYNYLYRYVDEKGLWPSVIRDRLCIYRSAKYYEIDDTQSDSSENFFNLKEDDLLMLDKLVDFRTEILDSTASMDSTSSIEIYYTDLTTNLSKLIHVFLDLKLNGNYSNFDFENIMSGDSLLEACYEIYVLEHIFRYISEIEGG